MARNPGVPIVNVCETAKTRWRSVPHTGGKGLDLGCGAQRLYDTEFVIGVDDGSDQAMGAACVPNINIDARKLTLFANDQFDFVFSSFLLQYFPLEMAPHVLREWMRVVKVGGNVVLYLPDAELYPRVGAPDAHPKQLWDVTYDRVVDAMTKTAWNWDLIDFQQCRDDDEYALYWVFRKLK